MAVRIVESDALDAEAYCRLQREAYAAILSKSKVSGDYLKPPYFRWKYRNACGSAKIAIIEDGSRIVAANAMVLMPLVCGPTVVTAWQSCDTATALDHRGKGYFSDCLAALMGELKPGEIFFGYPNQSSMRGFVKIGWKPVHLVPTWVSLSGLGSWDTHLMALSAFDASHDQFSRDVAPNGVMIQRTAAYLNWRYVQHPVYQYALFAYVVNGAYAGYIVLRTADVFSQKVALVMEMMGRTSSVERSLLRSAAAWARQQGLQSVITLNSALRRLPALRAGFLQVPSWMLPKRQVLMGYARGEKNDNLLQERWQAHLGDWDVF